MKEETDDIFLDSKIVDHFVESFYNGEVKLDSVANSIMFTREEKEQSLTNLLSETMADYAGVKAGLDKIQMVLSKTTNPLPQSYFDTIDRLNKLRASCLRYITYAKSHQLIVETETMALRLRRAEEENENLKRQNSSLQKLNMKLAQENELLNRYFPNKEKGKSEVGDVT